MSPINPSDIFDVARIIGGVPVLGCLPGSTSARAGVRFGDIIVATNGHPVKTLDDYVRARRTRDDRVSVVVFRDGAEVEFEMGLSKVFGIEEVQTYLQEQLSTVMSLPQMSSKGDPDDRC